MPFDVPPAWKPQSDTWWSALAPRDRDELARLSSSQQHDIALQHTRQGWQPLPLQLVATFVDPEDQRDHDLAIRELTEYLQAEPHRGAQFHLSMRTFHVCRAHREARRVVSRGRIPARFQCPLGRPACPFMRALSLRPGHAIRLRPSGSGGCTVPHEGLCPSSQIPTARSRIFPCV